MKKLLITLFILTSFHHLSVGQRETKARFFIGNTKGFIENHVKASNGNLSYGVSDEGHPYIMDEDWDGVTAWYLDENSICFGFYNVVKSNEGKKALFDLKLVLAKRAEKINSNTYLDDKLYFTFSNPDTGTMALLVSNKGK